MTKHFKDHFSSVASQYAAYRPRYPAELFHYLVELCTERHLAWDCACGSGQATLAIAEHFEAVVATDASAEQIAAAPAHPRVSYRVARAENSGLEAKSVDLLAVAQALHWFDLEAFYAEARRVLKPGGVLAAWTYGPQHVEGAEVDEQLQSFYRSLDPFWPPERRHVEAGYRTLAFPFAELRAPTFTQEQHWSMDQLLGYLQSWSATARYIAAHGSDPVQGLRAHLAQVWGDPEQPRRVYAPIAMRVARLS